MNAKQVRKLKRGDKLFHKYYGPVEVGGVKHSARGDLFGVGVLPVTQAGRRRMMAHERIIPLLEDKYRLLSPLITDAQDGLEAEWGGERFEAAKVALFAYMEANPDQNTGEYLQVLEGDSYEILSAMSLDLGQQLTPKAKRGKP